MAELRSPAEFDAMYEGTPPWDIGRPQPSFRAVADSGGLRGRVLDAGCGTGEHALMAAAMGLDATGFDASPRAIDLARRKAAERDLAARFVLGDAMELAERGPRSPLGSEVFDTVIDSGLFHVFDDYQRRRYVEGLQVVTAPGGRIHLLCFSEHEPGDLGPRRVTQAEIRESFSGPGWDIIGIEGVWLDSTLGPESVAAWLATIERRALPA